METPLSKITVITGNKRQLLRDLGYNSIRGARNDFEGSDKEIYIQLRNQYNSIIDDINSEIYRRNAIRLNEENFRKIQQKKTNKYATKISKFFKSYNKASNVEKNVKTGANTFTKNIVDVYRIDTSRSPKVLLDDIFYFQEIFFLLHLYLFV